MEKLYVRDYTNIVDRKWTLGLDYMGLKSQ